jgi:hypothetical protein
MTSIRSRKQLKHLLLILSVIAFSSLLFGLYLFFKPHRNVNREMASEAISVTDLTRQFAEDQSQANKKYLASDGNSSVLEITGEVQNVSRNLSGATVIVLSEPKAVANVRCTMSSNYDTLHHFQKGSFLRIKGAMTAGNNYDSILQLKNDATLIDCIITSSSDPNTFRK